MNLETISKEFLQDAQFGFSFRPVSAMSDANAVINFTNSVYKSAKTQEKLNDWKVIDAPYRFAVVMRQDYPHLHKIPWMGAEDIIHQAFLNAGILSNDQECVAKSLVKGDFLRAGLPDSFVFVVLVDYS